VIEDNRLILPRLRARAIDDANVLQAITAASTATNGFTPGVKRPWAASATASSAQPASLDFI
jgi:hypothetical protein